MTEPSTFPVDERYGAKLLTAMGSYWYHYFEDRDKLLTHLTSVGHRQGQAYLDYLDTVATISRLDINVFHEENWYLLTLKESDRNSIYNVYGQTDMTYGGGNTYGEVQTQEYLFPLPTDSFLGQLVDIPYAIYNRVLYPSKTWTAGIDFEIDATTKLIKFREDPFESEYVARRDVYDDTGTIVDKEIGLWVYKGQWDLEYVYKHWAFAIGMQLTSSENYKQLMNAIWDAYAFGANMASMYSSIAAMFGVPFVIEPVETVEDITTEEFRKLVITDKHVYEFSLNANITVAIGDRLTVGQEMSDAIVISEFSGNAPDYTSLTAISLGDNYLSGGYYSELVFENTNVDLDYEGIDNDGKAVVTFRIQGFPNDVDLFFDKALAIAKANGTKTLAELLDLRDSPVTQPLPVNLPAQINPLEFALDMIMRNNLWLLKIRTSAIRSDAPGLGQLHFFRDIVPPHTSLLIFVEILPSPDTMDLSEAGDDETPGISEDNEWFKGTEVVDNLDEYSEAAVGDPSYQAVVIGLFRTSEECK